MSWFSLEIYKEILSHVDNLQQYYNCALVCRVFRILLLEMRNDILERMKITNVITNPITNTTTSTEFVNGIKHGYKTQITNGILYSIVPYKLGERHGMAFLDGCRRQVYYHKDKIRKEEILINYSPYLVILQGKSSKRIEYQLNGRSGNKMICYNKWIRSSYKYMGNYTRVSKYICGKKYKETLWHLDRKIIKYYKKNKVFIYRSEIDLKRRRCKILTKRKYD